MEHKTPKQKAIELIQKFNLESSIIHCNDAIDFLLNNYNNKIDRVEWWQNVIIELNNYK